MRQDDGRSINAPAIKLPSSNHHRFIKKTELMHLLLSCLLVLLNLPSLMAAHHSDQSLNHHSDIATSSPLHPKAYDNNRPLTPQIPAPSTHSENDSAPPYGNDDVSPSSTKPSAQFRNDGVPPSSNTLSAASAHTQTIAQFTTMVKTPMVYDSYKFYDPEHGRWLNKNSPIVHVNYNAIFNEYV